MGRPWKSEGVFKEKRFGCQASKDKSEWQRFVRGNATPLKNGSPSVAEPTI